MKQVFKDCDLRIEVDIGIDFEKIEWTFNPDSVKKVSPSHILELNTLNLSDLLSKDSNMTFIKNNQFELNEGK